MNNKELTVAIHKLLENHDRLSPQEIAYHIDGNPAMIQIHGVLGTMKTSGTIRETVTEPERVRYYSLVTSTKDEKTRDTRDLSKFSFDGNKNLSKGRLVLAIVKKYVSDSNPSLKDLKLVFPDSICKPYGIVQGRKKALELSPDPKRKRYFLNDEDIVRLNQGKVKEIVVTNQITQARLAKFLEVVNENTAYKIKSI